MSTQPGIVFADDIVALYTAFWAGLPAADRKPGRRYRLFRGRFTKCPEFEKLKPAATGTVAGHHLNEVPNLPDDAYALLLEGYLEIPETCVWSLAIGSDDGSRRNVTSRESMGVTVESHPRRRVPDSLRHRRHIDSGTEQLSDMSVPKVVGSQCGTYKSMACRVHSRFNNCRVDSDPNSRDNPARVDR